MSHLIKTGESLQRQKQNKNIKSNRMIFLVGQISSYCFFVNCEKSSF